MTRRTRLGGRLLTIHLDEETWETALSSPASHKVSLAPTIRTTLERAPRNPLLPRIRELSCTAAEAHELAEFFSSTAHVLGAGVDTGAANRCLRALRSVRFALRRA